MAKIVLSLKVYPRDININLDSIKEKIQKNLPKEASIYKFNEEPIAFGLVALIVDVIMPEEKGGLMDEVERNINSIDDVSQVEVLMVRRT